MLKGFIILCAVFLCGGSVFAQTDNYPAAYLGSWKGKLQIAGSNADIEMELVLGPELHKDSVWGYTLVYRSERGEDKRPYELRRTQRDLQLFTVDEKNSILLTERQIGNMVFSIFTVEGSTLLISLELLPEQIVFEVVSWKESSREESGGKQEDVPLVYSYLPGGYQKAVLKRTP
ncbi:MAG: hypothetical protein ACT6QS_04575 [Flavobacteriales bacterium]